VTESNYHGVFPELLVMCYKDTLEATYVASKLTFFPQIIFFL